MDKREQDDGRLASGATHPPQHSEERQHQRELLADRIGQLLARRWFREQQTKRPSVRQPSPRLDTDAAEA